MRKIALLGLICWFSMRGQATALLGVGDIVYDPANHTTNILTSLQTTITAAQAVLHTGYWIVQLTGIEGVLGNAEFVADLATMQSLLGDARAIAGDVKSILAQTQRLFDPNSAPTSSWELRTRQQEIDQTLWEVYSYATQTQVLVATISHTIDHLKKFVERIGVLIGERQALQSINEEQAKMVEAQEKSTLMTTAFERGETYQRMQEPLVRQSLRNINESVLADWPTGARR